MNVDATPVRVAWGGLVGTSPQAALTLCWWQVNGQNVEGLRHAEVVASIKAREDEAQLLSGGPRRMNTSAAAGHTHRGACGR